MYDGLAIALAWPETLCKQAGSWYDTPLKWVGINKKNYYKVGHAALVLIEKNTGHCHYFDFGRYHTPFQHGRVRSAYTDHDLQIKTKAEINYKSEIENYYQILLELFRNESCHGKGNLHASYCEIHFQLAYKKAKLMQDCSPIRYGPFLHDGTNCSRFVNSVILSGKPRWLNRFLLKYPKSLSPTPLGNVKSLPHYVTTEFTFAKPTRQTLFNRLIIRNETAGNT